MKNNLNESTYAVEVMSESEMAEVNGGNIFVGILLAIAYDIVSNWDDSVSSFKKGMDRVANM